MNDGSWNGPDPVDANAGRWPGADRRRNAVDVVEQVAQVDAAGRTASTASTAATLYKVADLDGDDRARLLALCAMFGVNADALAGVFHVGRTRRGYVVMLTEYVTDDDGQVVHVLGVPVPRHHLQPVQLEELPMVCRRSA